MNQVLDLKRKFAVKSNSVGYLDSHVLCYCLGFNSV